MIAQLKEILAKPDQTLGFYAGELHFWLAWAQEVAGDHSAARESWSQARTELESFLKEQPENIVLIGDLALTNMALGDNTAAMTLTERAIAMMSIEKDALTGPRPLDSCPCSRARRRLRPRHLHFGEAAFDAIRSASRRKSAAHSCVAPARSNVRTAAQGPALQKLVASAAPK